MRRSVRSMVVGLAAIAFVVTSLSVAQGQGSVEQKVPRPPRWTTGLYDHDDSGLAGPMSCPTSTFCMAIDGFGWAQQYDGTSWSPVTRVIPESMVDAVFPKTARVACASSTFCMATISGEDAFQGEVAHTYAVQWDGTTWSTPSYVEDTRVTALACPASTECLAGDARGDALRFDGGGWSDPVPVDLAGQITAISCASRHFCMAIGAKDGQSLWAYRYDGTAWNAAPGRPLGHQSVDISCPTADFCLAIGNTKSSTYDGVRWTRPAKLPLGLNHVACARPADCLATGGYGFWVRFTGKAWGTATWFFGQSRTTGWGGIACPAVDVCLARLYTGKTFSYDGSLIRRYDTYSSRFDGAGWSAPGEVADTRLFVTGLACPRGDACVVVDDLGFAQPLVAGTLQAPFRVDSASSGAGVTDVSCATMSFCAATDASGHVSFFDFDGTATTVRALHGELTHISCPATRFCMAQTSVGTYLTYDGSTWSGPRAAPRGYDIADLACTSSTFCLAVGHLGDGRPASIRWAGDGWHDVKILPADGFQAGLSCGTPTLCVVSIGGSQMVVYDGSEWGPPTTISMHAYLETSACGTTTCVVGMFGYDGGNHYGLTSVYRDGSWSPATQISDNGEIQYTACPPNDLCRAHANNTVYRLRRP